jgi:hypothetical protein
MRREVLSGGFGSLKKRKQWMSICNPLIYMMRWLSKRRRQWGESLRRVYKAERGIHT